MPRIDAPTVAEHHARRRTALLAAAVDVLGAEGPVALTPAAVAGRAGLARSSVYQYFPSTGALVGAAVEEMFRRAAADVTEALALCSTPAERIDAYVRASLDAALAGHLPGASSGGSFRSVELPPECRARVVDLHQALVEPLVQALAEHGVADAVGVAGLVNGVIRAAASQVEHGEGAALVHARLTAFVRSAVALDG